MAAIYIIRLLDVNIYFEKVEVFEMYDAYKEMYKEIKLDNL